MICVFAGPTIAATEIRDALPGAEVRPPARAGDIHAACREGATAIGLIDGFFDGVPSVWHKEILWALDQGIAVYGASSMGALRAAELHVFGMVGIGAIFEAYRDGIYEDDDEVALRHGPADLNYVPLSEPMVNIRATLHRATAEGIVEAGTATYVTAKAKSLHFPERSWGRVLEGAPGDVAAFRVWLPTGAVDQKRRDAVEMLAAMGNRTRPATPVDFKFQHTAMWETLTRSLAPAVPDMVQDLILDHLRRDPVAYQALRARAGALLVKQHGVDILERDVARALTRFRAQQKLYTAQALDNWLAAHGQDLVGLQDQLAGDLRLTATIAHHPNAFRAAVMACLQGDGTYQTLAREARQHAAALERVDDPQDADLAPPDLLNWYFETYCGRPVPDDLDGFVAHCDFPDHAAFEQMMVRAHVLWHHDTEQTR